MRGIHRRIPITKASNTELWCFFHLRLNKRLCKQSRSWWFETQSHSLWRLSNVKPSLHYLPQFDYWWFLLWAGKSISVDILDDAIVRIYCPKICFICWVWKFYGFKVTRTLTKYSSGGFVKDCVQDGLVPRKWNKMSFSSSTLTSLWSTPLSDVLHSRLIVCRGLHYIAHCFCSLFQRSEYTAWQSVWVHWLLGDKASILNM